MSLDLTHENLVFKVFIVTSGLTEVFILKNMILKLKGGNYEQL